ncbi:MAG: sensor domain-containing diguanylate cyclase [Pseudomonadota bacterium]
MSDSGPFQDFESAVQTVLHALHERLGFDLWMVTRTEDEDWIVLVAEDHGYSVEAGRVFRWSDSFCSRMVAGKGPQIAPDANCIEAYVEAPIARQVPIGAYIGMPLTRTDGSLFGTMCAIDPSPQPASITAELPLLQTLSRLLMTILEADLKAVEQARVLERVQKDAVTDTLTGLLNRRGWDQRLEQEEARVRRYGSPACVFSIDLDDLKEVNDGEGHAAGDVLLCKTADVLLAVTRLTDALARVGGDEFMVLAVETDAVAAIRLHERILVALEEAGVRASIGYAMRAPASTLLKAWRDADRQMYAIKAAHRSRRPERE